MLRHSNDCDASHFAFPSKYCSVICFCTHTLCGLCKVAIKNQLLLNLGLQMHVKKKKNLATFVSWQQLFSTVKDDAGGWRRDFFVSQHTGVVVLNSLSFGEEGKSQTWKWFFCEELLASSYPAKPIAAAEICCLSCWFWNLCNSFLSTDETDVVYHLFFFL